MTGRPPRYRRLPLLTTGDHDCPYLPDRRARTAFVDPVLPFDTPLYRQLLDQGFRRSGRHLYRPACPGCQACQSLRIPVAAFRPRRRHRRNLRDNRSVELRPVAPGFRDAHYRLYARYVTRRHAGGSMAEPTPAEYRSFLMASWCDSLFLELREDERLLAVAVVDRFPDALSAVYTFYEPDLAGRGLGTLAILRQIEYARAHGLDWLYLGYWIDGCERMAYKADFRPHDVHTPAGWQRRE